MWTFLAGDGYRADPDALRAEFPEIGWTRFADWAGKAFGDRTVDRDRSPGREGIRPAPQVDMTPSPPLHTC